MTVAVVFLIWIVMLVAIVGAARVPTAAARRRQAAANAAAPALESVATVVDKREDVSGSRSRYVRPTVSEYFVTFELPSGQRVELAVSGPTSGQLVVGDTGQLSWQGTWFRGFQRQVLR